MHTHTISITVCFEKAEVNISAAGTVQKASYGIRPFQETSVDESGVIDEKQRDSRYLYRLYRVSSRYEWSPVSSMTNEA